MHRSDRQIEFSVHGSPARSAAGILAFLLMGMCGSALHGLDDPGLSGGTAYAAWDVFTDASGGDNLPDAGTGGTTGFSTSPVLRQINSGSGAFITSTQNIYSFSGVTGFEIEGAFGGTFENLVFQFSTLGNEMDYNSISFSYGAGFSSTLAPTTGTFTSNTGGEISYLTQWDFSSFGGVTTPFKITFQAAGTSTSLNEARIDLSDTFTDVTPPAPIIDASGEFLGFAGEPVSIQIEATGEPFLYLATDLPSWLTLDNATGLISGTVPTGSSDVITFSVQASNGQLSEPVELELVTVIPLSYTAWVAVEELLPADSAAGLDPDKDSLSNLEEYFYGTDPQVPDASAAQSSLKSVTGGGLPDTLVLSFNWNRQAVDVVAQLEVADASFAWVSDAPGAALDFFTDGTAEASLITEESDSGFMRLTLSLVNQN